MLVFFFFCNKVIDAVWRMHCFIVQSILCYCSERLKHKMLLVEQRQHEAKRSKFIFEIDSINWNDFFSWYSKSSRQRGSRDVWIVFLLVINLMALWTEIIAYKNVFACACESNTMTSMAVDGVNDCATVNCKFYYRQQSTMALNVMQQLPAAKQ